MLPLDYVEVRLLLMHVLSRMSHDETGCAEPAFTDFSAPKCFKLAYNRLGFQEKKSGSQGEEGRRKEGEISGRAKCIPKRQIVLIP